MPVSSYILNRLPVGREAQDRDVDEPLVHVVLSRLLYVKSSVKKIVKSGVKEGVSQRGTSCRAGAQ